MAEIIRCDGDCGKESPDPKTGLYVANSWMNVIVRRKPNEAWRRHRLCGDCASRNVFLIDKNGSYVSDSGFASDVLR